ncbi:glycosyltransferase family 4 protein [Patescibacteria group bacterium]|nr:glycosyltransferase family 4 protein [Patescibacteria group bacterium]
MRIGIDCRTILNPKGGERAGIAHYTYFLVKNLLKIDKKNQYVLFFDNTYLGINEFKQKNTEIRIFPFSDYKKYIPFAHSHILITAMLRRAKLDIYHNPAGIIPLGYKKKSIITIHDLAIYINPSWFPERAISRNSFFTKILIPSSIKRARKIIASSENTKKDILKFFKVEKQKIEVNYLGVTKENVSLANAKKTLKKFKLYKPYILYLGTIEPRKNLILLIHAYERLIQNKKIKDVDLVLAGGRGWKFQNVFKAIDACEIKQNIKYLGYVDHIEKLALIKNAQTFVFPTLYEGFGLPVLEAMSFKTPVISSKVSSIPEVAGNAAILINPNKEKELELALAKVINNKILQKKLAQQGYVQSNKFKWTDTAKRTLQIYQQL